VHESIILPPPRPPALPNLVQYYCMIIGQYTHPPPTTRYTPSPIYALTDRPYVCYTPYTILAYTAGGRQRSYPTLPRPCVL